MSVQKDAEALRRIASRKPPGESTLKWLSHHIQMAEAEERPRRVRSRLIGTDCIL